MQDKVYIVPLAVVILNMVPESLYYIHVDSKSIMILIIIAILTNFGLSFKCVIVNAANEAVIQLVFLDLILTQDNVYH